MVARTGKLDAERSCRQELYVRHSSEDRMETYTDTKIFSKIFFKRRRKMKMKLPTVWWVWWKSKVWGNESLCPLVRLSMKIHYGERKLLQVTINEANIISNSERIFDQLQKTQLYLTNLFAVSTSQFVQERLAKWMRKFVEIWSHKSTILTAFYENIFGLQSP